MKKSILSIALVASFAATSVSTSANAEGLAGVEGLSANVGYTSKYFYRGIYQSDSSASAGLDYEKGNFSIGTWAADVEDGIEVDVYASYGFEFDSGLALSIGATTYQYTGDFDSAYNEVNLGASYGIFSLEYSVGVHEEDKGLGIEESDYDFIAVTLEGESGLYATFGTFGQDFDGDYFEVGYGTSVGQFDLGVAIISNSEELDLEGEADGEESIVFSIGTSF